MLPIGVVMTASITPLRTDSGRSAIDRVEESTTDEGASVTVVLHWDGRDHVGQSTGPPSSSTRPLLVARATLQALPNTGEFEAIDASITKTAGVSVALVAVADPSLKNPLVGTAVMPHDNAQLGFARATLDAVNRRIDLEQ